jgi:hypothetical protein
MGRGRVGLNTSANSMLAIIPSHVPSNLHLDQPTGDRLRAWSRLEDPIDSGDSRSILIPLMICRSLTDSNAALLNGSVFD